MKQTTLFIFYLDGDINGAAKVVEKDDVGQLQLEVRGWKQDFTVGNKQKTSWNKSNTVLVIQRRGRVLTQYKNRQKVCLVHYN